MVTFCSEYLTGVLGCTRSSFAVVCNLYVLEFFMPGLTDDQMVASALLSLAGLIAVPTLIYFSVRHVRLYLRYRNYWRRHH
jgi:hypothetical protein